MFVFFTQNRSNTLTLPIQCTVNVASYRDIAIRITGALRIDTLHAVSMKPKTSLNKVGYPEFYNNTHACKSSIHVAGVLPSWWQHCSLSAVWCVCEQWQHVLISSLQLKFKILELGTSASVELPSSSPMFLHEERPVRHVSHQPLINC